MIPYLKLITKSSKNLADLMQYCEFCQESPKISRMYIDRHNNCGLIRYFLAGVVLYNHVNNLLGLNLPFFMESSYAVGGFFTLSGLLVHKSYTNSNSPTNYLFRRVRRILPAYLFTVLLCAFALVAFSKLSANEYFKSPGFWKYLGANITYLNFLHPTLPGVFLENSSQVVNSSLWTLKNEWVLYLTMPLILLLKRHLKGVTTITFYIVLYAITTTITLWLFGISVEENSVIYKIGKLFYVAQYYFIGTCIYYYFPFFTKWSKKLLIIILLVFFLSQFSFAMSVIFKPIFISFLVVAISFSGRWADIFNYNNISYEIYLLHFPVAQVIGTTGIANNYNPFVVMLIVALLTVSLGFFSWFAIDKHFLLRTNKQST